MIASMRAKSSSVAVVGKASTYLSLKTLRPLFSIAPMLAGIVVIEPAFEPFALVDGEIELEFIAAAPGWIGPDRVREHWTVALAVAAEIKPAAPGRLDAGGKVEKARQLGERDRPLIVEIAD